MLSADAALEVSPATASSLDTVFNKLSYTLGINGLEWIGIKNLMSEIVAHKGTYVITGESEGHLGKVIGTE